MTPNNTGQPSSSQATEDLLQLSSENSCDEEDIARELSRSALRRMAIIDVCNVLYGCALHTSVGRVLKERCDAAGLVLMARRLLKAGFDFKMFVPISYMNGQNPVCNQFVMEELQRLDYLTVINDGAHDDFFHLEMAKCGGFVISNDRFRDHKRHSQVPESMRRIIDQRSVPFSFSHVPIDALHGGGGKRALADPKLVPFYLELDFVLKPPNASAMFALDASDPSYGIVFDQRMLRSQRRALDMEERLDVMAEFLLQDLCRTFGVRRPLDHLGMPRELVHVPERYSTFWRMYEQEQERRWQERNRRRQMQQMEEQRFF